MNVTRPAGAPINTTYDGNTVAPAFATLVLGAGALLAGVAGGSVSATNSPTVLTSVGTGHDDRARPAP